MVDGATGGELAALVHNEGDHVAVAIRDLEPGEHLAGFLDTNRRETVLVTEPVPLGHKIALLDLPEGADVVEYTVRVALTRRAIARGELVHTHNVRSARWQQSA